MLSFLLLKFESYPAFLFLNKIFPINVKHDMIHLHFKLPLLRNRIGIKDK